MRCREKHDGNGINTHMACSDRQTGVDGIWTAWRQKGNKGKKEGGLMIVVENEQVLWFKK